MNEIFVVLIIICIGIDTFKLLKRSIDFNFWYKSFTLLVVDKFIIKGNPSLVSDIIILYFCIVNILVLRNIYGFTKN